MCQCAMSVPLSPFSAKLFFVFGRHERRAGCFGEGKLGTDSLRVEPVEIPASMAIAVDLDDPDESWRMPVLDPRLPGFAALDDGDFLRSSCFFGSPAAVQLALAPIAIEAAGGRRWRSCLLLRL